MQRIIFPHIDSEVNLNLILGDYGDTNLTMKVGHYLPIRGGNHDEYWVAEVKRIEVTAVDGNEDANTLGFYNDLVNRFLRTGKIIAEIEEAMDV